MVTLSINLVFTIYVVTGLLKGAQAKMRCYVCGPGDDELQCKDPTATGLDVATCLTNARYCSMTLRRSEDEVTYLSRECAETCTPEDSDSLKVTCCQDDGCNHAHSISISTALLISTLILKLLGCS